MTIFYESDTWPLIISDTGVLVDGNKIPLTKIVFWRFRRIGGTVLTDVQVRQKCFPAFINWMDVSIRAFNHSVADGDFETYWIEHSDPQRGYTNTKEECEANFKAQVDELKLVTRALDLMMASKQ